MFSYSSISKAWFVLSVAILGVGYGIMANQFGWFPSSLARQTFFQFENLGWVKGSLHTHKAVYDREGTRAIKPQKMGDGLTAVASWWRDSGDRKYGVKLIDENGQELHAWWVNRGNLFSGSSSDIRGPLEAHVDGFSLMPNGDLVATLYYIGLVRLNSCGKVIWKVPNGAHHSVTRSADESFWVPGVHEKKRQSSGQYPGGFPGLGKVWLDQALHVSPKGEIRSKINILDILYNNNLDHLLFAHRMRSGDVTHINDVDPLKSSMADSYPLFKEGDILISIRNINTVLVYDPDKKSVKWYETEPFIQQHDPDFIGNGWIGIFDNNVGRGEERGGSRIIGIQPHTDSTRVLFEPTYLDRFYTSRKGDWTKLENENMLLTETFGGRVVEVSPDGELVWEWIHESYESGLFVPYDYMVPTVPVAKRYDLTRGEVARWPCSSVDSVNTSQNQ